MQLQAASTRREGFIHSSTLLLIAFATAFFPRVLDTLGAPPAVNFLHFATIPLASAWAILQAPVNIRSHIISSKILLVGLFVLLGTTIISALINQAGVINVVLSFLLLAEPFMFLLALVWTPISPENLKQFKKWMFGFSCFHILLALAQKVLLDLGILKTTTMGIPWDNVQGVFYLSGSGHVVGASVSISYAIYYIIAAKNAPLLLRLVVMAGAMFQVLAADARQVMLVCFVAFLLLIVSRLKNIKTTIQYVLAIALLGYAFWWCMQNVPLFYSYNSWVQPELYGPQGEATLLKISSVQIILSHYQSALHGIFGFGPGHTVGRLGGWMLAKYWDLLSPLGATIHPISEQVWDAVWASRLGARSSMFSPLFGWVGIWGDIGWLGLGVYWWLCSITWNRFCPDDFSKFLMLNVFVNGFIFTQMEEPGYMLFVAVLIGLRWHEICGGKRLQNLHQEII